LRDAVSLQTNDLAEGADVEGGVLIYFHPIGTLSRSCSKKIRMVLGSVCINI